MTREQYEGPERAVLFVVNGLVHTNHIMVSRHTETLNVTTEMMLSLPLDVPLLALGDVESEMIICHGSGRNSKVVAQEC